MTRASHRFETLDGIRGIAAIAVLLFHCGSTLDEPRMMGHGALAVDVFFVMSGFVVDRAYGARLRAGWPRRAFAAARAARLYPLYAAGLLLGAALQIVQFALQGRTVPVGALAFVMLTGALLAPLIGGDEQQVFPLNGPAWSLMTEALMNVAFGLKPRWGPRLLGTAVGCAALGLVLAAIDGVSLLQGGRSDHLWVDILRGVFGFGAGVLISKAVGRWGMPMLRGRWATAAAVAILGTMLLPRTRADLWFDPLAILLLCPATILLGTAHSPSTGAVRRLCARLGALSYPLYIVHAPLLKLAAEVTPPTGGRLASPRVLAVSGAAALGLVLAGVIARWVEPRLPRRLAQGRGAGRPAAPVWPAAALAPPAGTAEADHG